MSKHVRVRPRRGRLLNPVVWISLSQVFWIAVLVAWIVYVIDRNDQLQELTSALRVQGVKLEWGSLVWGLVLLVALFVTMVFISVSLTRYWSENRAIHAFVSTVSHELRTPLASIRLYLETLQSHDDLSGDERTGFVETMLGDVDRLNTSIDAILTVSRIERRALELELVPLDLAPLVCRWVADRQAQVEMRKRHLSYWVQDESPIPVRVSADAVETVLGNLVENAVRYSDDGGDIRIDVSAEKGHALLKVIDEGRGIRAAELKKVLKMFYRSKDSTGVRGTGLGLHIVQGLVRAMRGEVVVHSEGLGRGTTVVISLPLAGDEEN